MTISLEAKKKKWSGKVETKWHPPEGFFERSADDIAHGLKKNSKNRQQAMARLNFYINRAGKNLSEKDRKRLELAKVILTRLYDEEEKRVSKENHHEGLEPMDRDEFIRVYKDFLKRTGIPASHAIVGAGGSCLLFGLREGTMDIDLEVNTSIYNRLKRTGHHEVKLLGEGTPLEVEVIIWSDRIDVHETHTHPDTQFIDGVCTWTPEYTLAFKKRMNREKDQNDIKLLEAYIKDLRLHPHKPVTRW